MENWDRFLGHTPEFVCAQLSDRARCQIVETRPDRVRHSDERQKSPRVIRILPVTASDGDTVLELTVCDFAADPLSKEE